MLKFTFNRLIKNVKGAFSRLTTARGPLAGRRRALTIASLSIIGVAVTLAMAGVIVRAAGIGREEESIPDSHVVSAFASGESASPSGPGEEVSDLYSQSYTLSKDQSAAPASYSSGSLPATSRSADPATQAIPNQSGEGETAPSPAAASVSGESDNATQPAPASAMPADAGTPVGGVEPASSQGTPAALSGAPEASPTPPPSPTATPEPEMLHMGDSGPTIKKVQSRLMELYYMDIDEPTDYFGQQTYDALQLFQRQHRITVDGIIGQETLDILFSDEAQNYTVDPNVKGFDVKRIQERLKELGYFSGEVTYLYGEKTEAAVRAFQKRNGLTVDARVGIQTRDMLFSPNAKKAPNTKSTESYSKPKGTTSSSGIDKMISAAKGKLGSKYVRGAEGPSQFDCSGLVYYALRQAGVKTGRLNAAGFSQVSSWTKVTSTGKLKKGDLLFWRSPGSSRVSHSGIYLGGGQFVHASSSKGKVLISSFSDYWRKNFVCGRRVF